MSLDIRLTYKLENKDIFVNLDDIMGEDLHFNITHNLTKMAGKEGYTALFGDHIDYLVQVMKMGQKG